jgi:hypothetical protein
MNVAPLLFVIPLLAAQDAAVVEGVAFNRVTHVGLAGVTIRLSASSESNVTLYISTTNPDGVFRIEGVKPGDYIASFAAPDGFQAPNSWDPECLPFHVAAGGDSTRLRIQIAPLGTLRGRVLDPDGQPVPRIRVELFRIHASSGAILTTDSQGRFFAYNLGTGAYRLRARPALAGTPLGQKPENVTPLPAHPPVEGHWIWAPTYFPDAIEISSAQAIVVHEGEQLDGYVIHLRAAPAYRLRGTVSDDEGKPAGDVDVWLLSEIGWGTAEARMKSGSDGAFEFPSVRAGDWQIVAEATRGATKLKGFTALAMPQHDVDDAAVRIDLPFPLAVELEGLPRDGRVKTKPFVRLEPIAGPNELASAATTQPDGSLKFEDVYPGLYRVGLYSEMPSFYVSAISLGPRDITGRDVALDANSPPVRVIFKPNAASATGTVENGAGIKVVFVEADREGEIPGQFLRATVCDGEGRFQLAGLRPTTYYAFAFTIGNVESDAVFEAAFTRGLWRQAQSVHLDEGATVKLDLHITPWPD